MWTVQVIYAQFLRIQYERLDEAMEATRFALCREPELFPLVLGTHIRRLRLSACLGVPECDIWFTFDDRCVRLLHIETLPE